MEFMSVEHTTLEAMMARFVSFAKRVESLCRNIGDKSMQEWLDNQEVCQILGISKRTLQTYRNSGILPYSQTGHKIIYRSDDVKQVFERYMIEK